MIDGDPKTNLKKYNATGGLMLKDLLQKPPPKIEKNSKTILAKKGPIGEKICDLDHQAVVFLSGYRPVVKLEILDSGIIPAYVKFRQYLPGVPDCPMSFPIFAMGLWLYGLMVLWLYGKPENRETRKPPRRIGA